MSQSLAANAANLWRGRPIARPRCRSTISDAFLSRADDHDRVSRRVASFGALRAWTFLIGFRIDEGHDGCFVKTELHPSVFECACSGGIADASRAREEAWPCTSLAYDRRPKPPQLDAGASSCRARVGGEGERGTERARFNAIK